jgi:ADP-ribose pyrophosphatase
MKKPKVLNSATLFEGHFKLIQDTLQNDAGQTGSYTYCSVHDAAVILAQTPDGRYIVTYEYRHPIQSYILGLPGGSLHPNEDISSGALRELQEETGYTSDNLHHLGTTHQMPGLATSKVHFFHAENAYLKSSPIPEPFEFIQVRLLTLPELQSTQPLDSHLLVALALKAWK